MKKQIEKIAAQGIICVYRLEALLSLFCSVCFVICFLAGQADNLPLVVEASIYCAILVLVLAAMLFIHLLMNLKKSKIIHTEQYIIALLLPVVVLFEEVLMYGAAHF